MLTVCKAKCRESQVHHRRFSTDLRVQIPGIFRTPSRPAHWNSSTSSSSIWVSRNSWTRHRKPRSQQSRWGQCGGPKLVPKGGCNRSNQDHEPFSTAGRIGFLTETTNLKDESSAGFRAKANADTRWYHYHTTICCEIWVLSAFTSKVLLETCKGFPCWLFTSTLKVCPGMAHSNPWMTGFPDDTSMSIWIYRFTTSLRSRTMKPSYPAGLIDSQLSAASATCCQCLSNS